MGTHGGFRIALRRIEVRPSASRTAEAASLPPRSEPVWLRKEPAIAKKTAKGKAPKAAKPQSTPKPNCSSQPTSPAPRPASSSAASGAPRRGIGIEAPSSGSCSLGTCSSCRASVCGACSQTRRVPYGSATAAPRKCGLRRSGRSVQREDRKDARSVWASDNYAAYAIRRKRPAATATHSLDRTRPLASPTPSPRAGPL